MPLISNFASNAALKIIWLLVLLVFTAPEGTPVGIMTEQLEMVTRATHDAPPGSNTVLRAMLHSIRSKEFMVFLVSSAAGAVVVILSLLFLRS